MKLTLHLAAVCGLFLALASNAVSARPQPSPSPGAVFASSASNAAHLIIKRSPSLGTNISASVTIDGRVAGSLVRGRSVDRYLVPGRHHILASPSLAGYDWHGTIDLRAGETCVFIARYNVNRLVLDRVHAGR